MLIDAIPVEAVTATLRPVDLKTLKISQSKTVFPVPEIGIGETRRKTGSGSYENTNLLSL